IQRPVQYRPAILTPPLVLLMIQPGQSTVLHRSMYNQPGGMEQMPGRHRAMLTDHLLYGCRRCGCTLRTDATGVLRTTPDAPLPVQCVEEGQRERSVPVTSTFRSLKSPTTTPARCSVQSVWCKSRNSATTVACDTPAWRKLRSA